jgi:energy-coupling factor transport system ATP-binding protein
MTHSMLEMIDFCYTYPDTPDPSLKEVSVSIAKGECVCFAGPSGCGKTTLLLAIAGLLKGGSSTGLLRFTEMSPQSVIGMVFQNAESQILSTTVEDEVAFGPMNLNISAPEIAIRVKNALNDTGLSGYEKRNVEALSAGEKHRLTIASILSMKPTLLILDEPTAQLDEPGKKALVMIMEKLKKQGYTMAVADHNISTYKSLADRFVFMDNGQIDSIGKTPLHDSVNSLDEPDIRPEIRDGHKHSQIIAETVISLENVCISNSNDRPVLDHLTMHINRGELIHIFGENGAGKSTILKCIVGLAKPSSGQINVLGIPSPKPEQLQWKVGLLLQNPTRQLFEDTACREVSFSLRRQGLPVNEVDEYTINALTICEALHLRDRSPFALSYGEQHRVAFASAISARPKILLLDEPFSGLDFRQRLRLLKALKEFKQQHTCAVLITSHDPLPDANWADRSFILQGGTIAELQ